MRVQALTGADLGEDRSAAVEAKWLRCYLTEGAVQCSQRLLDATWAGSSACQTLQTPAVPLQPLKLWQLMQRGRAVGMCAS